MARAAVAASQSQGYVSSIDVLIGIDWLDAERVECCRRGQVDYLERVFEANLSRIDLRKS